MMDNLVFADFLLQIAMITIFAFLLLTLVVLSLDQIS